MKSCECAIHLAHTLDACLTYRCLTRTLFKVLCWLAVYVLQDLFNFRMTGNGSSGSLNWMDGGAATSMSAWLRHRNCLRIPCKRILNHRPLVFTHGKANYDYVYHVLSIHLIYAIFRGLHGTQRHVMIIIPRKSASSVVGPFKIKWITRRRTNLTRIPIAREVITHTTGQANEALVGESVGRLAYQSARREGRYTNVLEARLAQSWLLKDGDLSAIAPIKLSPSLITSYICRCTAGVIAAPLLRTIIGPSTSNYANISGTDRGVRLKRRFYCIRFCFFVSVVRHFPQ